MLCRSQSSLARITAASGLGRTSSGLTMAGCRRPHPIQRHTLAATVNELFDYRSLVGLIVLLCCATPATGIAKSFVNASMPELRPTFVVNFDMATVICQVGMFSLKKKNSFVSSIKKKKISRTSIHLSLFYKLFTKSTPFTLYYYLWTNLQQFQSLLRNCRKFQLSFSLNF